MYLKKMKKIIDYAHQFSLIHLETFVGYKGADILKLKFKDNQHLVKVRDFCRNRNIEVETKMIKNELIMFCIFEIKSSDEVYGLKP